ncbi:MAG: TlpA family protein disulfide reductase [Chitinophagaceae bacterium]|nr:TlpA family protein disulfide reductase [Chitinophagaceae bacterium]
MTTQYLPRFYADTGTYLPAAKFINEEGHEKTLADFRGKILYVDIWATWCGNCLVKFPYQEQLLKRLKAIHLDTSIQFINISIEDTKSGWKKALKKFNPVGIIFTAVTLRCIPNGILSHFQPI